MVFTAQVPGQEHGAKKGGPSPIPVKEHAPLDLHKSTAAVVPESTPTSEQPLGERGSASEAARPPSPAASAHSPEATGPPQAEGDESGGVAVFPAGSEATPGSSSGVSVSNPKPNLNTALSSAVSVSGHKP